MADTLGDDRPLTFEDLTAWFAAGGKPPSEFRVGAEHEKFVFRLGSHEPVAYDGAAGIRALMGPPPAVDDWARDALNRARGVGDFETLLNACVELGARFIVCDMGLRSLGIDRAGLRADVPFTIAGIVTLLEETKPGMHLVSL